MFPVRAAVLAARFWYQTSALSLLISLSKAAVRVSLPYSRPFLQKEPVTNKWQAAILGLFADFNICKCEQGTRRIHLGNFLFSYRYA